ncbi:hypothetical protein [Mesorhizobium sp. M0006]|uniref:hypothetical protein n=1 Tax=Mesorhizobium sp. M0006 TaxID=2956838 RepID=UPI003334AB47
MKTAHASIRATATTGRRKRVQEHSGTAPKGIMKRPATQWVKPGLIGRVKHLRGEDDLRHASLQDFREE